jgi:hypothetical protein
VRWPWAKERWQDSLVNRFDEVGEVASSVAKDRDAVPGLLALARLVGGHYAYSQILGRVGVENRYHRTTLNTWMDWFYKFGLKTDSSGTEQVWLGWDPVVVRPWRAQRLAGALRTLAAGPQGHAKAWMHKPSNHRVNLWMPMRLGEAWNGNHSLAVGIMNGSGSPVPATNVLDLGPMR